MFPPAFAPRMGYLCKYMKRAGWQPSVVTEQINENMFAFLSNDIPVTYVRYYHYHRPWLYKLEWIVTFLLDLLFRFKDRKMKRTVEKIIRKEQFDAILCSTYRTFPLPAAEEIARKYNLPLVADLRDVIEQYASNEYISKRFHTISWLDTFITRKYKKHLLKHRNQVLRKADCVTTVSPWHTNLLKQYNPNTRLIYNGYDPELFFPAHPQTRLFRLTYTGRILSLAIRDPRPLFEAVRRLDKEGVIEPALFRLTWYIDRHSEKLLQEMAKQFHVEPYMDYFPYIPAHEIPEVLQNSSILLQIANKSDEKGPKGIMSTKLFEAMATEKPLLCVRSDESFLEQTIRETRTGASARTADEAYAFISEKYRQWQQQGYTSVEPDREAVERFSRKKQAEQFMRLFEELKQKRNNHG